MNQGSKTTLQRFLTLLIVLCMLFSLASLAVAQNNPPSLTDFHQFYGSIQNLPLGTFILVVESSGTELTRTQISNAQYGYSPTLKVRTAQDATLTFFVLDTFGTRQPVGTATYSAGTVEQFNLDYLAPATSDSSDTGTTDDTTSGSDSDSDSSDSDSPSSSGSSRRSGSSRSSDTTSAQESSTTCRYNWQCSGWTTCQGAQQTRTCVRIDNCNPATMNVTQIPKPEESRTCQPSRVAAAQQFCEPNTKRCNGDVIEQCSFDGSGYDILQICPGTCDPLLVLCQDAQPLAGGNTDSSSKFPWVAAVVSGVTLLALVVVAIILIRSNNKKYAPLKEYITKSKQRGMNGQMIKSRLVARGWDPLKVDKFLKK